MDKKQINGRKKKLVPKKDKGKGKAKKKKKITKKERERRKQVVKDVLKRILLMVVTGIVAVGCMMAARYAGSLQ